MTTGLGLSGGALPDAAALRENEDALFRRTELAAARGARLAVWNEAATLVAAGDEARLLGRGREAAKRLGVDVVLAYGTIESEQPLLLGNRYAWEDNDRVMVATVPVTRVPTARAGLLGHPLGVYRAGGAGETETQHMTRTFCRYDLRTTDVEAARAFYVDAVGLDLSDGSGLGVWPLHEQARARGAPAHWLGSIAVTDLAATVQRLRDRGGELLGPPMLRGDDGEAFAILRDPGGAVLALRETARRASREPVGWHQLHTRELDRAGALYAELFGWLQTETVDLGGPEGRHRVFRWRGAEQAVGGMADTARLPGVHPHWLFYFPVSDLARTLAEVSARGGRALAPVRLPNGDRLAACEDPQGAAFGLLQRA